MKIFKLFFLSLLFVQFLSCKNWMENKSENRKKSQDTISKLFASGLQWTGSKIIDDNYSIWGCSPVLGDDGKVHVFASRWPEKNVDPAWRKSSEIAHYVADTPDYNR